MRAHFTPQAEIDLEEIGDYIALTIPGALSRSFARCDYAAKRLLMDRIIAWCVQTWATRYGFAHTEIT
jgi:hypothetical protein